MMRKAMVLISWIGVCGLFVAGRGLFVPQSESGRIMRKQLLAYDASVDEPPWFNAFAVARNEDGEWERPSRMKTQVAVDQWVRYAGGLEYRLGLVRSLLKRDMADVREARTLFWIALALAFVNAAWNAARVLPARKPEKGPESSVT
jgi:hypothetical protein